MWHTLHTKGSFALSMFGMTKKKILIVFGDKVRELRKEKGLSQEEVSFKADLHRTYIGMIERAEKNITLANIEKIANALNVNIKELFNE
jgi:transcriptional regulator with XRE-family HTH domain